MAHGTGLYWERKYSADIKTDEYVVRFYRLYDYYYPEMSDCYEPSCIAKNEYRVDVLKWRQDTYNRKHRIADFLSEHVETPSIDKNTANKIWWNLKNKNISFDECKKYFETLK